MHCNKATPKCYNYMIKNFLGCKNVAITCKLNCTIVQPPITAQRNFSHKLKKRLYSTQYNEEILKKQWHLKLRCTCCSESSAEHWSKLNN